jgi:PKD repeat protein
LPVVNLGNDTTICTGQSYIINPGTFSSYLWQDGTTNSTFAATVTGTYTVTVTEQDCKATDSIVVTVQPCALPLANLSSSDTTFCEKQCIDFFDLTVNNPTSWLWTFNGASPSTSTDQNPAGICYNNYGSFDVQLIACNNLGCDTVLFSSFITEVASPPAPLITQSNDTLFCNTTQVTYAWYNVNNVNLVLGTNNYFVPTIAGSYYIVISDSNDCNVASATFNSNVGFNELLNDGINIFHNQQAGIVYITNTNLTNAIQEIKLFDLQGKCIEKNTVREQTSQIKLPNSSSIYFVNITTTIKNYVVKIGALK